VTVLIIAEAMTGGHHHHLMHCNRCSAEWYDDLTASGFPSHRDVPPCDCPEDGRRIYVPSVMLMRTPESRCRCGPAELATRITARP
jgi:hypothetical protein